MRAVGVLVAVLALAYLALCLLMFLQQRSFVYLPAQTRADAPGTDFAIERDGVILRGWIVNESLGPPVLYFGGNAESVEHNRDDFRAWLPHRSVYLLAYRGYGASEGVPREQDLKADALALFDHVSALHPGEPVGVIGRSLGSGVAAHVAAHRPVAGLALITPFDSMAAVGQAHFPWLPVRWLLRERYDSAQALRDFTQPVLVLRAANDEIIPARNTDRLIAALPRPPQVVDIADAGHNDLSLDPPYGHALSEFFGAGE
ncbi:alpha/beta hydrolase [Luteimonas sp. A277]